MKIATAIGILSALLLMSSCNTTNYPNEINTVDSLLMRIDTAQKVYAKIDTTNIREEGEVFKRKFNYLTAFYQQSPDTISREAAFLVADYRTLRKPYAQFFDKYHTYGAELAFSEKQLVDLRFDLEHNLLDTNFVTRMVYSEKEAVEKVVTEIKNLSLGMDVMVETNGKLEPVIDSLINVIKLEI